jgi:redox-sensitive bicupin YhaK (pirin superfamily)
MSVRPSTDPACADTPAGAAVAAILEARSRDVGGIAVRRLLPAKARRLVGPFVFFDHVAGVDLAPGHGIDVLPHPHIGLATVTYLFEGELLHRDSLGSAQSIRPGDVNWMNAGRGIVHSERTPDASRRIGSRLHALQLWVALPAALEESEPSFDHHPGATLPQVDLARVRLRVLAGAAYGVVSPVRTSSPLFYVDAALPAGCELPLPGEHEERAAYVVEGAIRCGAERTGPGRMLVFAPGANVVLRAEAAARLVLIGGVPLGGERHLLWNFVSSSRERLERAKRDWREGRFPKVPGDDVEFEPFPE